MIALAVMVVVGIGYTVLKAATGTLGVGWYNAFERKP